MTEHWNPSRRGQAVFVRDQDLWSNRIIGYSIDSRMTAELAVAAVRNAVALRDVDGTILHSDRGSQFQFRMFVELLRQEGIAGLMGRVGACGDNAAMELFFALLQKNVPKKRKWRTPQELRLAMVTWIGRIYHRRRRQRGLGTFTPIEFEIINSQAGHAA